MVVGSVTKGCQVAIIGSGPGGYLAAIRLAQLGRDVILIEKEKTLGGVCLNEGCIPSKALLHASDFVNEIKHADRMGITIGQVSVDLPRLMQWKESVVKRLTDGVRFLTDKNGVQVIRGAAKFSNQRRLTVEGEDGIQAVDFETAVIATGSIPRALDLLPVDGRIVVGTREAQALPEIPKRLLVLGAGYNGLELGSFYAKMGSEVTIIDPLPALLPHMDAEVGEVLSLRLQSLGVKFLLGRLPTAFQPGPPARLTVRGPEEKEEILESDVILAAVGRAPNTRGIGLETAGVAVDEKGFIRINNKLQTNVPGIYAIGDVAGQPMLAHKAYREAKVVAEVIAGQPAAYDNIVVPAAIYTDPEIAWVGLSEKEATAKGMKVITGTFPLRVSGRALTLNAPEGFIKSIGDAATKRLLGVVMVGHGVSEIISEAALAIEMGAYLDDLQHTIHPHPTLSEALMESVDVALGEAAHIVPIKNRS